ncbi:MAG: radical SAM family heme chaperone HemW [Candidatus Nanopelagicaceae bacterium]
MSNLSFYIHIPYCTKRCGYCDFNTYTPNELREGGTLEGVSAGFIDSLIAEVTFAARTNTTTIPTIFFGGGTPSLIPAKDLGRVIDLLKQRWEFAPNIEITMECNPDTLTLQSLEEYRAIGINRISMGMQSANSRVLKVLDRTHNPENVAKSVANARSAGFDNVSLDLIYGAPGETLTEWQETVTTALSFRIDHLSAYALIVETGTKLAAQIKRGEIEKPNDDLMAEMYLEVDKLASNAGLNWYELSNWGRPAEHNLVYWRNQNWWGLGPGAHSHIDGVRWWNVKHPTKYQSQLANFESPMQDRETLTADQKRDESFMLKIRLREGLAISELNPAQLRVLKDFPEEVEQIDDRLVLTSKGRLIADRIVRTLIMA